ncbi:MAG: TonB-dependent receptor [Candidatus Omnitrophota bacterium]
MKKILLAVWVWGVMAGLALAQEAADLGKIVVTPGRDVQAAESAPAYVNVISRDEITASGARSVPDVLAQETGVHVFNKGSLKNTAIDIGGYNDAAVSNVLVLLNGRRLNPSDSSGPDLAQIPLESVERIEVIRGGASVLYGDNAVGGVVNIITRKGWEGVSGAVALEAGSYGLRKESAQVSAGSKDITVYALGSTQETNGYRANNAFQSGDGQVRVNWKAAPLLQVGVEGGWHEDHYGMPSGLSVAQMETLGLRGTRKPDDYGDTRDRFIRLTADWTPVDSNGDYGTLSMDYAHRDRDIYGMVYYPPTDFEWTKTGTLNDTAGVKYRINGTIAGKKAGLVTGVDLSHDGSHTLDQYYNPVPAWSSYRDIHIARQEQGYYARGEYEVLDRVTADIGARYEKADYTFTNRSSLTKTKASPTETLWGGGLKYDYAPGSNVFIRADETFRFLNTDEWFSRWTGLNTALKHQSGIDYRMGIKHALGEMAEVRVTPFMTRNRQEIFLDPTVYPGNNANYSRTRRIGVDAGNTFHLVPLIQQAWLKTADLSLDYTYLEALFEGGAFDGKKIPLVPEHQVSIGFDAVTQAGLAWHVKTRLMGAQFGINDDANTKAALKPSLVTDTRLGYQLRSGWETFVGVNNIFNERYYDYLSYGTGTSANVDYYPAMDRNYTVGMKYKF